MGATPSFFPPLPAAAEQPQAAEAGSEAALGSGTGGDKPHALASHADPSAHEDPPTAITSAAPASDASNRGTEDRLATTTASSTPEQAPAAAPSSTTVTEATNGHIPTSGPSFFSAESPQPPAKQSKNVARSTSQTKTRNSFLAAFNDLLADSDVDEEKGKDAGRMAVTMSAVPPPNPFLTASPPPSAASAPLPSTEAAGRLGEADSPTGRSSPVPALRFDALKKPRAKQRASAPASAAPSAPAPPAAPASPPAAPAPQPVSAPPAPTPAPPAAFPLPAAAPVPGPASVLAAPEQPPDSAPAPPPTAAADDAAGVFPPSPAPPPLPPVAAPAPPAPVPSESPRRKGRPPRSLEGPGRGSRGAFLDAFRDMLAEFSDEEGTRDKAPAPSGAPSGASPAAGASPATTSAAASRRPRHQEAIAASTGLTISVPGAMRPGHRPPPAAAAWSPAAATTPPRSIAVSPDARAHPLPHSSSGPVHAGDGGAAAASFVAAGPAVALRPLSSRRHSAETPAPPPPPPDQSPAPRATFPPRPGLRSPSGGGFGALMGGVAGGGARPLVVSLGGVIPRVVKRSRLIAEARPPPGPRRGPDAAQMKKLSARYGRSVVLALPKGVVVEEDVPGGAHAAVLRRESSLASLPRPASAASTASRAFSTASTLAALSDGGVPPLGPASSASSTLTALSDSGLAAS